MGTTLALLIPNPARTLGVSGCRVSALGVSCITLLFQV